MFWLMFVHNNYHFSDIPPAVIMDASFHVLVLLMFLLCAAGQWFKDSRNFFPFTCFCCDAQFVSLSKQVSPLTVLKYYPTPLRRFMLNWDQTSQRRVTCRKIPITPPMTLSGRWITSVFPSTFITK